MSNKEAVNHPAHYGGKDNPYEAIKVIEAWGLGFSLGNCIKYIMRAGRKTTANVSEDLRKAAFYLNREIQKFKSPGEQGPELRFVVVNVGASDADIKYATPAGVLMYLDNNKLWKKAREEFTTKSWTPGDMMSFESGWIFCVNDYEHLEKVK